MNLVVLGVFSGTIQGMQGSLFLMLSHGIVSAGLFFMVGMLYDRYKTRIVNYFGGITKTMPLFSTFFFFFILGNLAMPGTSNFMGEFLIFISIIKSNIILIFLIGIASILCAVFSI
jgi:NADH:ubiquinone oxidoreductase subunit 4 (subunit M)